MESFGFIKDFEPRIIWDPEGQGRRPEEEKRLALSLNFLFIRIVWEDIKGCKLEKLDDLFGIEATQRQNISYLTKGYYNGESYVAKNSKPDSKTGGQSRPKTLNDKAISKICEKMAIDKEVFISTKEPGLFNGHNALLKLLVEEIEWIQKYEYAKDNWNKSHKEYMYREIIKNIVEKANKADVSAWEKSEEEKNRKKRTNKQILLDAVNIQTVKRSSKEVNEAASKEMDNYLKNGAMFDNKSVESIKGELDSLRIKKVAYDGKLNELVKGMKEYFEWNEDRATRFGHSIKEKLNLHEPNKDTYDMHLEEVRNEIVFSIQEDKRKYIDGKKLTEDVQKKFINANKEILEACGEEKTKYEQRLNSLVDKTYDKLVDKFVKDIHKLYFKVEEERHKENSSHTELIRSLRGIYESMMAVPETTPRTNVQKIIYFLRHENVAMDGMATEMAKKIVGFLTPKEFWKMIDDFNLSESEYLKIIENYRIYESMLVSKAALEGINVQSLNQNCKKYEKEYQ